jgi:hypothetical protein
MSMTQYATLREIALEPDLDLSLDRNASAGGVIAAIDKKLMSLQSVEGQGGSLYRKLVEARQAADRFERSSSERRSSELDRLPNMIIEKLAESLQAPPRVAPPLAGELPAQLRIENHRHSAATKASADFRNGRSIPLAGLGVLVAAIWGTRTTFGARLSGVGTALWSVGASLLVAGACAVWVLAARSQRRDESVLRGLYDPEVQEQVLRRLGRDEFERYALRWGLWQAAVYRTLRVRERVQLPRRENWATSYHRTREDWYVLETAQNDSLGVIHKPLPETGTSSTGNWYFPGKARFLSTVDLASALLDATDLSLARFQQLDALEFFRDGREWYKARQP